MIRKFATAKFKAMKCKTTKFESALQNFICVLGLAAIALLVACSSSSSSSSTGPGGSTGGNLTQISTDPYTAGPAQHATEVEPHLLTNGNTLVATFQVGRFPASPGPGGGSTDIGWATSTDGGTTWSHGYLPGLTTGEGTGPYEAASDPVVAYDAKHQVWMISSLPVSSGTTPAVLISRSTDGMTWNNPVNVAAGFNDSDKNWIVCDSGSSSPYYGNCYVEFDAPGEGDQIYMSTSSDGGLTWSTPVSTANVDHGIGGQPLVQPNGTVVVPILGFPGVAYDVIGAFTSSNGGASWGGMESITQVQVHTDAGGIRSGPLPSAAIDGAGNVWIVWEDCRFRSGCSTNDLVYVTSPDGVNWSVVTRVPIDETTSSMDHFIPGISIDPTTSGSGAHVGIHYYYYSQSDCTLSSCQLSVGFISSANGGTTGWNSPTTLAGPMQLGWLPNSQNGLMVGDYVATAFTSGVPHGVFAVASANSGTTFSEAIYTAQGLSVTAQARQLSSAHDKPLHKLSDKIEIETPEKGIKPPARKARRSSK
jgi:hypothetical protein